MTPSTGEGARVLIVEADDSTARALAYHLTKAGFRTSVSRDGCVALAALTGWRPDAVIVDLDVPRVNALEIIEEVRQSATGLPVIAITAQQSEAVGLNALDRGADDFLRKPFSAREMVARLTVALRRRQVPVVIDSAVLSVGDMEIDRVRLEVRLSGARTVLTPREAKLLWVLAGSAGTTVTRTEIYSRIWGQSRPDGDRSVDVLVRRLRRKVDEVPGAYTYVQTDPRRGYRLEAVPRALGTERRRAPARWRHVNHL